MFMEYQVDQESFWSVPNNTAEKPCQNGCRLQTRLQGLILDTNCNLFV